MLQAGEITTFGILRNSPWYSFVVLAVLVICSLAGWVLIMWKWAQFRRVRRDGFRFVQAL